MAGTDKISYAKVIFNEFSTNQAFLKDYYKRFYDYQLLTIL